MIVCLSEMPPHYRRNFLLSVANGVMWNLSESFANDTVVTAVFLSQITESNVLIGVLSSIRIGGWFLPQFFVAPLMARYPQKVVFYNRLTVMRVLTWAFLIASIVFLRNQTLLLLAVTASLILIALADGLGGLPFMLMMGKTIPADKRGELFAWRNGLGSLVALAGSVVLGWLLGSGLAFPNNYALAFGAAAICFGLCYVLIGLTKEPPDAQPEVPISLRNQWALSLDELRSNTDFRNFLLARCALMFGLAALPFVSVFAKRVLAQDDAFFASMVTVLIGSTLLGNVLFGRLSQRLGGARLFLIGILLSMALCVAMLLAVNVPAIATACVVLCYALIGISNAVSSIALGPLTIQLAPARLRSLYIGLTNTLVGVAMLSRGVLGWLADAGGYSAFFAGCLILMLFAIQRARMVRYPKHDVA